MRLSGDDIPLRDPAAPIGVISRFDAEAMSGDWIVRGRMPRDSSLRAVTFITLDTLPTMVATFGEGEIVRTRVYRGLKLQAGHYAFSTDDRGDQRDVVVVWVDEGFRTAAIGDPRGTFAWVLDRAPEGGVDRVAAARQVLEFSGFDLRSMQLFP